MSIRPLRLACEQFLVVALVAATAVLAAPLAFAEDPSGGGGISLVNEADNEPCTEVTLGEHHNISGGCDILWVGSLRLNRHIFGFETIDFECQIEFEAQLDENAEGYLKNQGLWYDESTACSDKACDEGVNGQRLPWHAHMYEPGPGSAGFITRICLEDNGESGAPGVHRYCTFFAAFGQSGAFQHEYVIVGSNASCTGTGDIPNAEVDSSFITQRDFVHHNVEAAHQ